MARILIPIGGNEKQSRNSEIFKEMMRLAGNKQAHVVIVPTASDKPEEKANNYHQLLSSFEPKSIHVVHIGERADASKPELMEFISKASLFLFGGGDQLRLSSLIGGTRLHKALIERYNEGSCVVSGTSAGAAVLPEIMIFQNNNFRLYRKGGIEMTKGLGLVPDMIIDTHFVSRSRISRLVHAVASNPALLGFGLEEDTGLIIEDESTARIVGSGTVIVVDGSTMDLNHIGYAENGSPFTLTNVSYSVLTAGVVYDIKNRKVLDPGPTAPPKSMVPKGD